MPTKYLVLGGFGLAFVLASAVGLITGRPAAIAGHTDANANPLPHATYRIWDLNASSPAFGFDANMTVSDPNGATVHVATAAAPFTNVTVMENTICSGRPCGVTYWNPATNLFKCYGYSSGAMTGVDVNRSAPTLTAPDGTTYPQGSTWLFKSGPPAGTSFVPGLPFPAGPDQCGGRCSLTVHFPGTNSFRSWEAGNASSGAVDQASGLIWVTDQSGFIGVFDPATDGLTRWNVGGVPRDIVVDGSGRAYATVGPLGTSGDQIVRIDPSAAVGSQVTTWAVPAVGHSPPSLQGFFGAFSQNPNGIEIDAAGRLWFAESISNEIGSLDPTTNTFVEYLKVDPTSGTNAIVEPQNVAASGTGASFQAFFSEGTGNSTGIVTPAEAAGTTQEIITVVTPATPSITPQQLTLPFVDHTRAPSQKTIPPTVHPVDGVDGVPWTAPGPTTAAGEVIPGILRFPLPTGFNRAVGMTEVFIPNTVFGSLIGPGPESVFEMSSQAIIAEVAPPEHYLGYDIEDISDDGGGDDEGSDGGGDDEGSDDGGDDEGSDDGGDDEGSDDGGDDNEGTAVDLTDQFITGTFIVKEPDLLFTPVDKNEEGVTDAVTHLLRYEIETDDDADQVEVTDAVVVNQFGTFVVDTEGPDFLLVPTVKGVDEAPSLDDLPGTVDHFLCHGLDDVDFETVVTLTDQFGTADYEVDEGKWLCNPASKTVNGDTTEVQNPEDHLMCFEVDGPDRAVKVQTDNQFGPEAFEVTEPELLCLPSEKTLETESATEGSSISALDGSAGSGLVFTGSGFEATFAVLDSSDPATELCTDPPG